MKLCNGCKFLSPTEEEQNNLDSKLPHFCKKYKKQVKHSGHHPYIVRPEECMEWIDKPI